MGENKTEHGSYMRELNDYFSHDKQIGEEIEFVFGKEVIKITKTQEFENAVEKLEKTHRSAFITGKAGTGKSTLLKYFRSKSEKDIAVLAFTGLAAINVGGETIHSFFNLPIGFLDKRSIQINKEKSAIIRAINTIVLDEVSMIRADLMDAIDISLKKHRANTLPFGGVQMIFIGDLHQLPPVIEKELKDIYSKHYKTPFFFSADVFQNHKIIKIDLQKIHRQTEPLFVDILNNLREKKHVAASAHMLNRNLATKDFLVNLQTDTTVVLCTTNDKTRKINDYYMTKINNPVHEYKANVSGLFDPASYPTDEVLTLKEGCKVMFIKNDTHMRTYVNGDIGVIRQCRHDAILVETKGKMISVERGKWEKYKYDIKYVDQTNEDGVVEKKKIVTRTTVGSFEQYPLKLAWAISIHKSQGQTYDNVLIDFDRGCFTSGQAYVALSRCRSYNGVKLRRPMLESDVILDPRIHHLDQIIDNERQIDI
jgi:ATP-dependent DNA helicase PIF1